MKTDKGFTLLEIIVVVFILGLLAAIIAPRIIGRTDDARITEAKVQIRNFETALKLFKIDNGFFPSTEQGLDALIEEPDTGRIPGKYREGGYLEGERIPPDPWDNPYQYQTPGTHNADSFDLWSFGPDKADGTDDDLGNWD